MRANISRSYGNTSIPSLLFSRKNLIPAFIIGLFVCSTKQVSGQGYIGIRTSSLFMANPAVANPSPANIFASTNYAFETAIEYTHMINRKWGFAVGGDFGVVNWSSKFTAPIAAFGTRQGSGEINSTSNHSYLYNSAILLGVYKIYMKKSAINVTAGTSFRFHQTERTSTSYEAYNRMPAWNRFDPNADPADLTIRSSYDNSPLKTNLSAALHYERAITEKFSAIFGLRTNVGFKNVEKAVMTIQMNDQTYYGSINSRPDYMGLDIAFRYRIYSKKVDQNLRNHGPAIPVTGTSRKIVYVEALGNGLLGSVNFDMRFKQDRNDGLGFRVGLGLGENLPIDDAEYHSFYSDRYTSLPFSLNYIVGKKRNGLEAGIGLTPQVAFRDLDGELNLKAIGFMNIGYRLQPLSKGLVVRVMVTPSISSQGFYAGWGGVSLGYGFK